MSGPSSAHADWSATYSQETWDARYAESSRIWSGQPNPRLVEQVAGLPVADALDVGCGEGADAVWLATRGWRVTALDVSQVALERTAAHARDAGVADLVTTVHHDLFGGNLFGEGATRPLPGGYGLVSMQFMHPPAELFDDLHRRVGAAVRPGGTLLVVGHHPDDLATGVRRPHGPGILFTPERVVAALGSELWEVRVAEAQPREQRREDGVATVTDSVVVAVRR